MQVKKLIKALKQMPQDAYVWHLWDGEARTQIKHVWLAREGRVITADDEQVCYTGKTRPKGSPTEKKEPYWKTPVSKPTDEDVKWY
jgi:hypothetical protein